MKKLINFIFIAVLTIIGLTSCENDPVKPTPEPESTQLAYIVNYGAFSSANGEVSMYNIEDNSISHNIYNSANEVELASNVQSLAIYNDKAYLMSNEGDKIDIVNATDFKAVSNPISTDIVKPRYSAATESTLYVSCWGLIADWQLKFNSYIAKIELATNSLTKIPMSFGPEGLIIVDNKLYAALSTTNQIAVMDLNTEEIEYIVVPAIPVHFVQDNNNNLCVSLVNSFFLDYSNDSVGVAIINPANNKILNHINYSEIGSNGLINISNDGKTIYVVGNEPWPETGSSIYTIDINSNTLSDSPLIEGESFTGLDINPKNDDIYVSISPSATETGTLKVYDKEGNLKEEMETGIYPQQVVFYDIEE